MIIIDKEVYAYRKYDIKKVFEIISIFQRMRYSNLNWGHLFSFLKELVYVNCKGYYSLCLQGLMDYGGRTTHTKVGRTVKHTSCKNSETKY